MVGVRFFLDTNALMYLDGLKGSDLQIFKVQMEKNKSKLSTTHIQIDEWKLREEEQDYRRKIEKVLTSLKNKGIVIELETPNLFVVGITRIGFGRIGNEELGKVYDELRKEVEKCEKTKGRSKTPLNIACDATIAVSSLGHDFFITTDECLFTSWVSVICRYTMLGRQFKIPKIIYARRSPELLAKQILGLLIGHP